MIETPMNDESLNTDLPDTKFSGDEFLDSRPHLTERQISNAKIISLVIALIDIQAVYSTIFGMYFFVTIYYSPVLLILNMILGLELARISYKKYLDNRDTEVKNASTSLVSKLYLLVMAVSFALWIPRYDWHGNIRFCVNGCSEEPVLSFIMLAAPLYVLIATFIMLPAFIFSDRQYKKYKRLGYIVRS